MSTFGHLLVTPAHTTSYLETGPEHGPLLVFVHGWPGLASTWRHQFGHFAARGYRVVAPPRARRRCRLEAGLIRSVPEPT
jgi:pimeloyl-ACP methyl ester carboxylesterase